ncbi:MAG: class I SAM-dependent methyltransferase [Phototrophicaceae bacterium]
MTISYYDDNSQAFFDRTIAIDLSTVYDALSEFIPSNAHILDAGCGSGRDSKAFLERGYSVSAFDASAGMVALARAYTGVDVQQHTFEQMAYHSQFDAVWANASLLHVPRRKLPQIFEKVTQALKKNGMFYLSFKNGRGEITADDGRHFTYFEEARMRDFIAQFPELLIEQIMLSPDSRPNQPDWLNVYVRYVGA